MAQGEGPERGGDGAGQLRGDMTTAAPDLELRVSDRRESIATALFEFTGPLLIGLEAVEAITLFSDEREHLAKVLAVLAPKVAQQIQPLGDLGEAVGILIDAFGHPSKIIGEIIEFGAKRLEASRDVVKGSPPHQRRTSCRQRIEGTLVIAKRRHRRPPRSTVLHSARQEIVMTFEHGVFIGACDRGGVDLGDLELQQVDLSTSSSLIASETGQFRLDRDEFGSRLMQSREVDSPETVDGMALMFPSQQTLIGVLAMKVHERSTAFRQRRSRRQAAVHIGPAASVTREHPGEHDLVIIDHEPAFDYRLVGPGSHERRIGSASE